MSVEEAASAGLRRPSPQRGVASRSMASLGSSSATKRAGQLVSVGAIRKAGFLSVKKWILKRRQSVEMARKQGWKRYWVCLRGTTLLFHAILEQQAPEETMGKDETIIERTDLCSWIQANCSWSSQSQLMASFMGQRPVEDQSGREPTGKTMDQDALMRSLSQCYIEREPRHLIIIEGAIVQPIPEHPKRDHVFCLSTSFGDAYLFQASCQLESENWMGAVHNACAARLARDLTRDEAVKLFESRVRRLELDAEKKLFLRQRLESRLVTMSSISNINLGADFDQETAEDTGDGNGKQTMRLLLIRLNQQLVALDNYIEEVHCEIYQLRCYLFSCGSQQIFYNKPQHPSSHGELPHPKSLLMHVSKATKLLLIRMGVFTVSSLHAFIHARQGSAETILQRMQGLQTSPDQPKDLDKQLAMQQQLPPLELRLRSDSWAGAVASGRRLLEASSEQLIDETDLRLVSVRVSRELLASIRRQQASGPLKLNPDERLVAFQEETDDVQITLKLNSSSSSMSVIRRLLSTLQPECAQNQQPELAFLNYYLHYQPRSRVSSSALCIARRRDTLADLGDFEFLRLEQKLVFSLRLCRKRMDEESAPFGISIGAQLFVATNESQLNVYCQYVEWAGVACKSGLKDEDEILAINGVPLMDLDLMFVECMLEEEQTLRLVVRSARCEAPPGTELLDSQGWWPPAGRHEDDNECEPESRPKNSKHLGPAANGGSQVISDEYISSLVCPPPPSRSSAFLRSSSLVRQKSDLGPAKARDDNQLEVKATYDLDRGLTASKTTTSLALINGNDENLAQEGHECNVVANSQGEKSQSPIEQSDSKQHQQVSKRLMDPNSLERLKKSIFELLETEYAFIRHLETIGDHYMAPLEDSNYLSIGLLRQLSQIVLDLIVFQRRFFDNLTSSLWAECPKVAPRQAATASELPKLADDSEELNEIVKQIDAFTSMDHFRPIILALARTFRDEADGFKVYAAYCTAYSELQKFLHQGKRGVSQRIEPQLPIVPLDSFVGQSTQVGVSSSQHRDFFKPLSSFMGTSGGGGGSGAMAGDQGSSQLRQLGDFLGNLDSSSSSVSLSLPASRSMSTAIDQQPTSNEHTRGRKFSRTISSGSSNSDARSSINSSSNHSSHHHTNQQTQPSKSVHQQNFESYLIKPIQRIVKYPMLLGSISISAKHVETDPESGVQSSIEDQELERELEESIKLMGTVTSFVNDAQRIHDEFGHHLNQIERLFLSQLQKQHHELQNVNSNLNPSKTSNQLSLKLSQGSSSLIMGPHQPPISLSMDNLLYFGPVEWLNINDFSRASKLKVSPKSQRFSQMLFVFNSCVVFICMDLAPGATKKTLNQSGNQSVGVSSKEKGDSQLDSCNLSNNKTAFAATQTQSNGPQISGPISMARHKDVTHRGSKLDQPGECTQSNKSIRHVVRYQTLIPVSEVQVRSVPSSSSSSTWSASCNSKSNSANKAKSKTDAQSSSFYQQQSGNQEKQLYQWELFRCSSVNSNSGLLQKFNSNGRQQQNPATTLTTSPVSTGKVYVLASHTNEDRNLFLRKIRLTIRDSVRNMSLPLARSPSSKSLTPKKISSPSEATTTNNSNSYCSQSNSLNP